MVRVFLKKEGNRNYTLLTFYPRIYCKSSVVLEPSGLSRKKIPALNRCDLYLCAHLRCIKPKKTFPVTSSMELTLLLSVFPLLTCVYSFHWFHSIRIVMVAVENKMPVLMPFLFLGVQHIWKHLKGTEQDWPCSLHRAIYTFTILLYIRLMSDVFFDFGNRHPLGILSLFFFPPVLGLVK